jgi:two-component system, probable response regulator PhcQ
VYQMLLIDDEPNILSALRRSLSAIDVRRLDGEALRIEIFTSPEAAVERAEEQAFDLIMSDYRMPTMNGVEVLSRMMESQPDAPRVIISGYADRSAIIAAVNDVHLMRFIEKPWNDEELRETVIKILTRDRARPGGAATAASMNQLQRLEQCSPGITELDLDDDGAIVIPPEDWNA